MSYYLYPQKVCKAKVSYLVVKSLDNLPIWVLTVAYAAHIIEEYFLDWRGWTESVSKFKLTWAEFFVANFAVIVLGLCSCFVGFACPLFSYMFVGLALANAFFAHIGTTIIKRRFSPGLLTSIFLFLPICIWAYIEAAQKSLLTPLFIGVTLAGGCVIMMFPILLQMIKAKLKSK